MILNKSIKYGAASSQKLSWTALLSVALLVSIYILFSYLHAFDIYFATCLRAQVLFYTHKKGKYFSASLDILKYIINEWVKICMNVGLNEFAGRSI